MAKAKVKQETPLEQIIKVTVAKYRKWDDDMIAEIKERIFEHPAFDKLLHKHILDVLGD